MTMVEEVASQTTTTTTASTKTTVNKENGTPSPTISNTTISSRWKLGDVVLTLYGVGVIVGKHVDNTNNKLTVKIDNDGPATERNEENVLFWIVRLWRVPEKSIVSSSLAYITESSIRRRLPIAPGMIGSITTEDIPPLNNKNSKDTTIGTSKVLILGYSETKDLYYAKEIQLPKSQKTNHEQNTNLTEVNDVKSSNTILELHPNQLTSSKNSATIYPLVEVLLQRAEQAANAIKTQYRQSMPTTHHVLGQAMSTATAAIKSSSPTKGQSSNTSNHHHLQDDQQQIQIQPATVPLSSSAETNASESTNTNVIAQTASRYLEDWTATVQQKTPEIENNAKKVWQMIKDDEITTLFEKCKTRLSDLTSSEPAAAALETLSSTTSETSLTLLDKGNELLFDTLHKLEQSSGIKIILDDTEYGDDEDNDDDDAENDHDADDIPSKNHDNTPNDQSPSKSHKHKNKNKIRSVTQSVRKTQRRALRALEQLLQQQKSIVLDATNLTDDDLKKVQGEFVQNMTTVLDKLQQSAMSDRVVADLFDTISSSKVIQLHQQITGRIIQTKSASLFVEGATRLHSRAMSLFGTDNPLLDHANKSGDMLLNGTNAFLKSFTERDAAIARIKSIELGHAVKTKLIQAIEIRTESMGGLDAIIAGALSNVTTTMAKAPSGVTNASQQVQMLVSNLHQLASTTTSNAHESLLSILSSQSRFRDIVLLRIEQSLCDLLVVQNSDETRILNERSGDVNEDGNNIFTNVGSEGDDTLDDWRRMIDPEQIVALVQGEGGTLNIFEPIAKRAMKQIDKQLTIAEQQIRNQLSSNNKKSSSTTNGDGVEKKIEEQNVNESCKQQQHLVLLLDGLQRIRKLMSGELSVNAIMDEIVSVLNDDQFVAIGEKVVQHSERILDAIENATAGDGFGNGTKPGHGSNATNRVVTEALQLAEKSGITKENVMKELDTLNVGELIGTAEQAVNDEKVRQKLFNDATDTALDFLLKILPSMPVPPLDGVKDGLLYTISNLSMEGFKVRKEDIQIDLAGIRATKRRSKNKQQQQQQKEQQSQHKTQSDISSNTSLNDINSSKSDGSEDDYEDCIDDTIPPSSSLPTSAIKATELLIIDVQNISASLDNALWSFEQTYLPYLKGKGAADVKMSGGAIRLQFELRKQKKKKNKETSTSLDDSKNSAISDDDFYWEPVLCLHDRSCSISNVELVLQGEGRLTWILNKLVTIFKGPLRDYVVRTIVRVLSNQSGWILKRLNALLNPYWEIILRTAKLNINDLLEADQSVIVEDEGAPDRTRIELVWRERLPLGMNLLMNDESGLLKVVDFPRGSAARAVCEMRKLEPDLFKGSTIIAVNGRLYDDQDELFEALKDPTRPKAIQFELAKSEEIEKLLAFVEGPKNNQRVGCSIQKPRSFSFRTVEFVDPGVIGIEFAISEDKGGLVVTGFLEGDDGIVFAAAKTGSVNVGDLLTHINDECVFSFDNGVSSRAKAVKLLDSFANQRPLKLSFIESYLHKIIIEKPTHSSPEKDKGSGPSTELLLNQRQVNKVRRIFIDGFNDVSGVAESSGIFIGDHLVFLNGMPIGIGCEWLGSPNPPSYKDVMQMLQSEVHYPIGLTFARPKQQSTQKNRWGNFLSDSGSFTDSNAETFCVVAQSFEQLGCVFSQQEPTANVRQYRYTGVVVADFLPVPGVVQQSIIKIVPHCKTQSEYKKQLSIESINGEIVPSYASVELVKNALRRSWKASKINEVDSLSSALSTFEIVLSDDDLKEWLKTQL